jgi:AcrR family transcriptional regulator
LFYSRRSAGGAEPPIASSTVTSEPSRSSDPRRRILDALIVTVAHKGYDRTTVDCVLQAADAPAAVFYEHFESKQDCFLQAIDELIGGAECIVLAQYSRPAPWPERVRLGLQTLLSALAENPEGARVAMVEIFSAGEAANERYRSALRLFVPILEEGRLETAHSEHLPPQTSEALVGGIASILHRRVLEHNTAELPALLGDLVHFALAPYLGHHRALAAAGLDASARAEGSDDSPSEASDSALADSNSASIKRV